MSAALTNHLLQSTVFAAAAGLLTLLLRNNHARNRYWIWLTASLKFLIPFSLFVELGHHLSWSTAPAISHPQLALVVNEISQPFAIPSPAAMPAPTLPVLPAIWISGTVAILIFWFIRWRRVAALLRTSSGQLQPGVFGIVRPTLYLPAGIADHLDDAQLNAIFAHELCHIRNRDNLTATLHMLVEAVFWFHPLVWWLGARLVDERERACDEAVVQSGSDPQLYAETILQVCKLYLESPLSCVSGISGSDLKKRIEAIMTNRALRRLNPAKRLALAIACLTALATPVFIGIMHAPVARGQSAPAPPLALPPPRPVVLAQATPAKAPAPKPKPALAFEVASVKPHEMARGFFAWHNAGANDIRISGNRVTLTMVTLAGLIQNAYKVRDFQVLKTPELTDARGHEQLYDIEAKAPGDTEPTLQQARQMLQTLLADRFRLQLHHDPKEIAVYDLVIAKNGPKLKASTPASKPPANPFTQEGPLWGVSFTNKSLPEFIAFLNPNVDLPVVDKTGLTGNYDFTLEFSHNNPDVTPVDSPNADRSIYFALEQQLGLKLIRAKEPQEILVIDHAERPSEN